jgi:hypothetical protein
MSKPVQILAQFLHVRRDDRSGHPGRRYERAFACVLLVLLLLPSQVNK